jgi:hypothetical protein
MKSLCVYNPKGNPFYGRRHFAASATSLTETAEDQCGVHRFLVMVPLAIPRRILPRSLLPILRHDDARRAVDPLPSEAMEWSDSFVIFIRFRVPSVIVDKAEIGVIEIIPLLPLMMTVMGFPIGQPSGRAGPL